MDYSMYTWLYGYLSLIEREREGICKYKRLITDDDDGLLGGRRVDRKSCDEAWTIDQFEIKI